jgi:large subunit ribosomal protein L5
MATTPRLKERYKSEIAPEMMKQFSYGNVMQVPRVQKVTLNIGLGEAKENARAVESATADIATISGQKPIVTRAKKAIANFKIRETMPIGVAVTLRGDRMYEFLDRLLNATLDYDKVDKIRGMQINIITTARNDEEGRRLLELMGMPFAKEGQ